MGFCRDFLKESMDCLWARFSFSTFSKYWKTSNGIWSFSSFENFESSISWGKIKLISTLIKNQKFALPVSGSVPPPSEVANNELAFSISF